MRKLRPYQKEGHDAIYEAWREHQILMYVQATGGGKTVTFVESIREEVAKGNKVVLVAHRRELITQAQATLTGQGLDAGIVMGSEKMNLQKPVQVCSIQTIQRRMHLLQEYGAHVYVFDEGHHAQKDNTYGKIIDVAVNSGARVLLVTASPYRLSGDGFLFLHSWKQTKLVLSKSLHELQADGWLVPIKYYAASIPDLTNVTLKAGEYREEEAAEAMQLAPIVQSYIDHVYGKKGVCFCVNVAHSKTVCEQYNRAGIPAAHLDADTDEETRAMLFEWLRQGLIWVLCNVGIVAEGTDMPNIDFVQLACPTLSLSKYLQWVGRVTRTDCGIDAYVTTEERHAAIAASAKPCGIVLDNAGCWMQHGLPETPHDWQLHFRGTKKQKKVKDGVIEVWVFVAEDEEGNRYRSTNPKELEGLRLIEITQEEKQRIVNLAVTKDFDTIFFKYQNLRSMNKPAYVAVRDFIKFCAKHNTLMVPQVWAHIRNRTVTQVGEMLRNLDERKRRGFTTYSEAQYEKDKARVRRGEVAEYWLQGQQEAYNAKYAGQLRQWAANALQK